MDKFPKTVGAHTEDHSHCWSMVCWGCLVRTLLYLQGKESSGFFELHFLHLPCTVLSQPSISGWFWTLGSPGGIIWKPRWRRLRIRCGPIEGSLVQHRAWSPVALAIHLYHSAINQLCIFSLVGWLSDSWWQKKAKQNPKICLFGYNRGHVHYPIECYECTYLPSLTWPCSRQGKSAVHRLWSLGCWSYLLSIGGHSVVLMHIQRSDDIFSMGSDIMRPA